jgi:predicted dehydrogenase
MKEKVKWGVLGVAKIAIEKVIPGMNRSDSTEVTAIASRELNRAQDAANALGLPRAFGSYEELLDDPEIEAVYNPLPNHLHVPWTLKAAEVGKHVLCEKPLALSAHEAKSLIEVRDRTGVIIEEAFMVRTHPQWLAVRDLIGEGRIGDLRAIQGFFSYYNTDPDNIRNIPEMGGGGLMDIGCYPITTSRFVVREEPLRVIGLMEYDPEMEIDRLTSGILEFSSVQSSFVCSTQLVPHQTMGFFGTKGRIEIEIPFNAPPDRPCRIWIDDGDLFGRNRIMEEFPLCDQYTVQGDLFSRAVRGDGEPPVSLEDSVKNMAVIDAIVRSAEGGQWETPYSFECPES